MSGAGDIPTTGGYFGQATPNTGGTPYEALDFMIRQIMGGQSSAMIVQVKSVSGGGVAAPARVSVQPMVNQVDGLGKQVPHGTVYDLPVFRFQGGGRAVIVDPAVGDIGLAVVCDRDISSVKATGATAGPGSSRKSSLSDGCYIGGFLGGAPSEYIHFSGGNVAIVSSGTLTHNGVNVGSNHRHSGVTTGAGTTGVPT